MAYRSTSSLPAARLSAQQIADAAMSEGLPTDNDTLNEIVRAVNEGAEVNEAARQVRYKRQPGMGRAARMAFPKV